MDVGYICSRLFHWPSYVVFDFECCAHDYEVVSILISHRGVNSYVLNTPVLDLLVIITFIDVMCTVKRVENPLLSCRCLCFAVGNPLIRMHNK